ncbi:hypothetical protein AYX15_03460 [Cryptococcus neoformans]|nr:hypothetical protein AYX15_03460 [Cryptococcus neoformans var. grubii]
MNRFEPGVVPDDEDPMGHLELGRYIKSLVTKERNKILTALEMSITHKTNLWLLADELFPSGYRKVSSILGHLAFLRERVVPWEKKVEDLKQETVRSKRRGKSKKLMIPTFFEFMDEKIKKNHQRGGWYVVAHLQHDLYWEDLEEYGKLSDENGERWRFDLKDTMEGFQLKIDTYFRETWRERLTEGWLLSSANTSTVSISPPPQQPVMPLTCLQPASPSDVSEGWEEPSTSLLLLSSHPRRSRRSAVDMVQGNESTEAESSRVAERPPKKGEATVTWPINGRYRIVVIDMQC